MVRFRLGITGQDFMDMVLYAFHVSYQVTPILICSIPNDVHFDHLIKVSARLLHCEITFFPFVINMNSVESIVRLDMYPSHHQIFNMFIYLFIRAMISHVICGLKSITITVYFDPSVVSHLAGVKNPVSNFLCPFDTILLFFRHLLTFWHSKMFQPHLMFSLSIPGINHFPKDP